jgi:hypothetical protein
MLGWLRTALAIAINSTIFIIFIAPAYAANFIYTLCRDSRDLVNECDFYEFYS